VNTAQLAAVAHFTAVWSSTATAEDAAPALTCTELDALLELFGSASALAAATEWISAHTAADPECEGHTVPANTIESPLFDENGNYTPSPGTEYPFSISDIPRAVARLLGPGWSAESGYWGTSGTLAGPFNASFTFMVDDEGDLCIEYDYMEADAWPESPTLPDGIRTFDYGVYLELASAADGLEVLAERAAAAIRAVTGH